MMMTLSRAGVRCSVASVCWRAAIQEHADGSGAPLQRGNNVPAASCQCANQASEDQPRLLFHIGREAASPFGSQSSVPALDVDECCADAESTG